MLSQRLANIIFAAALLVACAYFAWTAEGFETSGLLASSGLPSKFFPQLMLGCMAICAVLVGFSYAFGGGEPDEVDTVFADGGAAVRGLLMLGVCILCYVVWRSYGFIPMAVLLGPLSLLAMGIFKPAIYVVVLVLAAFIYAVFTYGLGIQLV